MLQQSIKHNNSIPRLFTAAALTMGLLLACKKDVLQDYSEHSDKEQQHNSIAFTCIENNSFNTKANTQRNHSADGSISNNNSSLKEVITLSECDSLYLILQEEAMSTGISETVNGSKEPCENTGVAQVETESNSNSTVISATTKAAPTTSLTQPIGLFAYKHSTPQMNAWVEQMINNHVITPIGGVLEKLR